MGAAHERVSLGIRFASLIARAGRELVFTTTSASSFVDTAIWPPRIRVRQDQHTLHAARSVSGRWLVHGSPDPGIKRTWWLRWYDGIDAPTPASEEPEPVPERDLGPFVTELEPREQRAELVHVERIESLHLCGELAVVVPRHVGLGERRHPYVCRDGQWIEETSLPPFDKSASKLSTRCAAATLRLDDGTDVLIWDGWVFAAEARGFVPMFDLRLDLPWWERWEPVPAPGGGLYSLHGNTLVELSRGDVRSHLPSVRVRGVQAGPGRTLLVQSNALLLYDPDDDSVAEIHEALVDRRERVVATTEEGGLVVFDGRDYTLRRVSASDLASLPRRRASEAPAPVPPTPIPALDRLGASARSAVAAVGERLVVSNGADLRFHTVDAPTGRVSLPSEAVAVAMSGDRVAALDAGGVLHLYDADGQPVVSREIGAVPRSLTAGPGGGWIVVQASGLWLVDPDGTPSTFVPVGDALAASADRDGVVAVVTADRRAVLWADGVLVDVTPVPEPLVAVAALDGGRFVCAGQHHLFVLDDRGLVPFKQDCGWASLAASPDGARVAWATSERSVAISDLRGNGLVSRQVVTYPTTFSEPVDRRLTVCGLAFLDDDRLAIALGHGCANIVNLKDGTALKLDPQPGDPPSRWVFVFGSRILVAG